MALKKHVLFKGVSVENCYIKVDSYRGDKANFFFKISYKATEDSEVLFNENYNCLLNLDGSNFIAQAYEHLKTLSEFSDAVDC